MEGRVLELRVEISDLDARPFASCTFALRFDIIGF